MKRRTLLLTSLLLLGGCARKNIAELRAERQAEAQGPILVAVAWPLKLGKASLAQGVDLAVEEINAKGR